MAIMSNAVLPLALVFSTSVISAEYGGCAYLPRPIQENMYPEWESYDDCAKYTNGELVVNPEHLKNLDFDSLGMAAFWVGSQIFYIKKSEEYLPVVAYDNGADDYSDGLVRSLVDGKISYYDANFRQVIAPKYDWGWPFKSGRALVCSRCSIQASDGDEHGMVTGGRWGYIDKEGEEVIPVEYSREEIQRNNHRP